MQDEPEHQVEKLLQEEVLHFPVREKDLRLMSTMRKQELVRQKVKELGEML